MSIEISSYNEIENNEKKESRENIENNRKKGQEQAENYKQILEKNKKLEQDKGVEADLEMKLKLGMEDNFINIIETKKEFELMYKTMGDILKANGMDISQEEIDKIKENGPKDLKEQLLLLYWDNKQEFKDMYVILNGVNRNGLQNFFDKQEIKFDDKLKLLKEKLEKEFSSIFHIPDSEKKFLELINKYYS